MSKTLFCFLALSIVSACNRPANKPAPVLPYCDKGQESSPEKQCRVNPNSFNSNPETELEFCASQNRKVKKGDCPTQQKTAAEKCADGDASQCLQGSTEFRAACEKDRSQTVCSGTTGVNQCTQAGTAFVQGETGCQSLQTGPCTIENPQISGAMDSSYCSPTGYQCQQSASYVVCSVNPNYNRQGRGYSYGSYGESRDPCLSGGSYYSREVCNSRVPNRSESGYVFDTRDRLESNHGDKYLLIALGKVGKDRQSNYSLILDATDRDISNIKVKYVNANKSKFDGKSGPVINAEISWEVRGRRCRGRETVFSLENYLKPKPLTAICEGTTR